MFSHYANLLQHDPFPTIQVALAFASGIAYPNLDIPHEIARIEKLTQQAFVRLPSGITRIERAERISDFLFHEERFRGNTANFTDPRNSFLNDVLERKLGLPITLALLYVEIAQRLGVKAHGVGLPGHFIVRVDEGEQTIFLDPFNGGGRLTRADCAQLVMQSTGFAGPLQDNWLEPISGEATILRMLTNLRHSFTARKEWEMLVRTLEHLQIIAPGNIRYQHDLGVALFEKGEKLAGIYQLEAYLLKEKRPKAAKAAQIRLNQMVERVARLN